MLNDPRYFNSQNNEFLRRNNYRGAHLSSDKIVLFDEVLPAI